MDFKGVLKVTVSQQKNKAGQSPLTIEFVGDDGVSLQVLGARLINGTILDPIAILPGGKSYRHTVFSPPLQMAIMGSGSAEAKSAQDKEAARQERLSQEMLERSNRAQGL